MNGAEEPPVSWRFDRASGQLTQGRKTATLTPKAAAVLSCLLDNKGRLVTHDTIIDAVWPNVHVQPDLVREYISDVRAALRDDAKRPSYIETSRGRGFRLVGPVEEITVPTDGASRPVIAVLRPELFAPNEEWRFMADTLAEDVTTDLARFQEFDVVARNSAFSVDAKQDIQTTAAALGADYLLEGSLSVKDSLRATFQLIRAEDGIHIWANRFEMPFAEVPQLSDEISGVIANELAGWRGQMHGAELHRLRRKPASTFDAYENYLMAVHYEHIFSPESTEPGLEFARKAAELDPYHARTQLMLFYFERRAGSLGGVANADGLARSNAAIERAYELDPRDSIVLAEIAAIRASQQRYGEMNDMLALALDYSRNQADALAMLANLIVPLIDDVSTARKLIGDAKRLNPFHPVWYQFPVVRIAFFGEEFERCLTEGSVNSPYMAVSLFSLLSTAMARSAKETREGRELFFSNFPGFDFSQHERTFPIVAPKAVELFRVAAKRVLDA